MAKKHWIYIKRGLSEDAKHRSAMGECVWLYMHIIDRADWETGIAFGWKDREEAADMSMPVDTLRRQRQKLEELSYIRTEQKQHGQDIYIMEWKNPRDYSSDVKNPRDEGSHECTPSNFEGLNQGSNEGSNQVQAQVETTTYTPDSESSPTGLSSEDYKQANAKVEAWLSLSQAPGIKREARIDSILSYFGGKFHINTENNRWKKFAKFVDDRQQAHSESMETFYKWLVGQNNFDIQFWPPSKMEEMWPRAFVVQQVNPDEKRPSSFYA